MNQNKTKPNTSSVDDFIATIDDEEKVAESLEIIEMMREVSGETPVMWGPSIIGFGTYHYKYASGREGDWMKIGFSPRKAAFSLYLSCDADVFAEELETFGKYKRGKGCIYFKRLDDIDRNVFRSMLEKAYHATSDYMA